MSRNLGALNLYLLLIRFITAQNSYYNDIDSDYTFMDMMNADLYQTSDNECNHEGFMEDFNDCSTFYRCVREQHNQYVKYKFTCASGTVWDQRIQTCNHPWAVSRKECRTSFPNNNIDEQWSDSKFKYNEQPNNPMKFENENSSPMPNRLYLPNKPYTPSSTSPPLTTESQQQSIATQSSGLTPKSSNYQPDSDIVCNAPDFYPHPKDCSKFYRCVDNGNGFNVYHFDCPTGTIFDPSINVCNYPESVYPQRECPPKQNMSTIIEPTTSKQAADSPKLTTTLKTETMLSTDSTKSVTEGTTSANVESDQGTKATSLLTTTDMSDTLTTNEQEIKTTISNTITSTAQTDTSASNEMTTAITTSASSLPSDQTLTTESPIQETTIPKDVQETTVSKDIQETTVAKDVQETTVSKDVQETTMSKEMQETTVSKDVQETTTSKDVQETTTSKDVQETTISKDVAQTTLASNADSSTSDQGMVTQMTNNDASDSFLSKCPIASNLTDEQVLLVCPTGFKRHPKFCNILYQCTTEKDMQINLLTLSCPEGTIFDETQIQCLPEAKSTQACMGSISSARVQRQSIDNSPSVIKLLSSQTVCPQEGYFPFQDGCSSGFFKCKRNSRNILQGYLYKCHIGFAFSKSSKKCEQITQLKECLGNNYKSEKKLWDKRWKVPVADNILFD